MVTIQQFAKEVTNFSSQYGSEDSVSYTVSNVAGGPNIYPNYGDFTQALVFRTYGPWWQQAPSTPQPFSRTSDSFISQDFVELWYEDKVYPQEIRIYETYHPGAVVRILALKNNPSTSSSTASGENPRWYELWSGEPESGPPQSRIFSPPLNKVDFPTNVIRLEFNHSHIEYYTELDAIELIGSKGKDDEGTAHSDYSSLVCCTRYFTKSENKSDKDSKPKDLDAAYAAHMLKQMTLNDPVSSKHQVSGDDDSPVGDNGFFDILPSEVIQLLFSYLDVPSLCNAALTCKLFCKHCYDPLQYVELDLQPYWSQIDDSALDGLHSRCRHLQRLNLSWTGGWGFLTPESFCRFIEYCGSELITLRLGCCDFLSTDCIKVIADTCTSLQELDLQSCVDLDNSAFEHICKLTNLQTLNLYRCRIEDETLINILRCLPDLEYLNIGSCVGIENCDDVLIALGNNCRNLKSLDVWRTRTLSHIGLRALVHNCHQLLELDVGWCTELNSSTQCFVNLVRHCKKLKKLFLTANRSVCDADLNAIAEFSHDMEQLDILGNRVVTPTSVSRVLENCKPLTLFDVSFCLLLDLVTVLSLKETFPQVALKKSFTH